jgi:hypothetical protein
LADRIGRATASCQPRDLDRYGRVVAVCFKGGPEPLDGRKRLGRGLQTIFIGLRGGRGWRTSQSDQYLVQRIGYVVDVNPDGGELTASFDSRTVTSGFGEPDTLVPAFAATIHKSQGSEYPALVIPVMTQHYPMLQRNLLYTGVTRGKKLVVIVGQKKGVAIAVRNVAG